MLFDTHVHLNAHQFENDLEDVMNRAKKSGVSEMVVVGFDEKTIEKAIELVEQYDHLYASVGWHPVDAIHMKEKHLVWLEELTSHPKIVALGEMGLDYHWDTSPKEVQEEVFRKQIRLAKKVKKPIIIHNREADDDVVRILKEENAVEVGGIMHCFAGNVDMARECLEMNFYISLGGPVTFKNATLPKEVAKAVPIDRLLIETDCPYLAPHPYRGKRNEPAFVALVAQQIADLRGLSVEDLAKHTTANAKKIFDIV